MLPDDIIRLIMDYSPAREIILLMKVTGLTPDRDPDLYKEIRIIHSDTYRINDNFSCPQYQFYDRDLTLFSVGITVYRNMLLGIDVIHHSQSPPFFIEMDVMDGDKLLKRVISTSEDESKSGFAKALGMYSAFTQYSARVPDALGKYLIVKIYL